jgi:hypothetical protein
MTRTALIVAADTTSVSDLRAADLRPWGMGSTPAVKRFRHTKRLPNSPTAFTNCVAARMATTLTTGCVPNSNSPPLRVTTSTGPYNPWNLSGLVQTKG